MQLGALYIFFFIKKFRCLNVLIQYNLSPPWVPIPLVTYHIYILIYSPYILMPLSLLDSVLHLPRQTKSPWTCHFLITCQRVLFFPTDEWPGRRNLRCVPEVVTTALGAYVLAATLNWPSVTAWCNLSYLGWGFPAGSKHSGGKV